MTISEFVVDSELFKKVSSSGPGYTSINELLMARRSNPQIKEDDEDECKGFYQILRSIKDYKYKLVLNKKIKDDYKQVVKMCPADIIAILGRIYSEQSCYTMKDEKLLSKHRLKLYNSSLKNKICYIDAAHLCENNKIIVSTIEYIECKYNICEFDLTDVCVTCENVFYVLDPAN